MVNTLSGEGGVRAISVVKVPDKIKPGTESNQLTSYIDIMPTFENIVGLPASKDIDGINIFDVFNNKKLPPRHIYLARSNSFQKMEDESR